MDYWQYLQSPEWHARTENIRNRNDGLCECCNMRYGTEVHHRTYKNVYNEKDEDLIHLCAYCHGAVHRKRGVWMWQSRRGILEILRSEADQYGQT